MRRTMGVLLAWIVGCVLFTCQVWAEPLAGFDPAGSGSGYPASANGRLTERPALEAHRLEGELKLDGCLDDPAWREADAATGFTQFSPDRKGEPCEDAVVKVLYDEDAVYFGVACYRLKGEPIISCLSRRDRITSSDRIRIYIDPYHDLTNGYHFRVNPDGVKEDYYNYGDLYHDISWDCVWDAETSRDPYGWYAEIRLPFSSIRYRSAESMTWGFNVFQYVQSRGQQTAWSNWDRDQSGFMSRSGTLTGIRGIRPPRQVELLPFVVGSVTDPSVAGEAEHREGYGNFGLDLKYGVTPDLTLNAAFQPDFGQVEIDPALLNLSPYEQLYEEKRPFFVEGNQYFCHPDFTLFYSRRIGLASENSRIRFASKLVGKTTGGITIASLLAATDETESGKAHNPFRGGADRTYYANTRLGREFHGGNHSVNLQGTAVCREAGRDAYAGAVDFKLQFKDRAYAVNGSAVGSLIADPSDARGKQYGSGARLDVEKVIGTWRGRVVGRLEQDRLDLNDLGYVRDPNHLAYQTVLEHWYDADGEQGALTLGNTVLSLYQSWYYADRKVADPADPGRVLWAYGPGHPRYLEASLSGYWETRGCWSFWYGFDHMPRWTSTRETRSFMGQAGPLLTMPANYSTWAGVHSDSRKSFNWELDVSGNWDEDGGDGWSASYYLNWIQSGRLNHSIGLSQSTEHNMAQSIGNTANPGGGIGGVSYVFAELQRRTWNLELRSSLVFTRDQTLELYLQPYLTSGTYTQARELLTPDSRDLRPYTAEGFDVRDRDFTFASFNLNMVYRWEYHPGSTFYLVWTHGRQSYDYRGNPARAGDFDAGFSAEPLFAEEPENQILAKLSYYWAS